MSFGQRSWIAAALLPGDVAEKVVDVRSELVLFGSTAGPFGGIGGAAMTYFQMTLIVLPGNVLVFADDRLLGWGDRHDVESVREAWFDMSAQKNRLRDLLQSPKTCPVALRERAAR